MILYAVIGIINSKIIFFESSLESDYLKGI